MPHIYKLWILQRDSGLNLVDATIEDFEPNDNIDPHLISGLLTSFLVFSKEILGEGIRLIETEHFRLIFALNDDIVSVVMMDRAGPVHIAEKILHRAQKRFTKNYQSQIEKSFEGDVSAFSDITKTIEEITQKKGIRLIHEISQSDRKLKTEQMKNSINALIKSMKN